MTYDDGVIGVYELTQTKMKGKMPVDGLSLWERYCFGYEALGMTRYYTALQANQQIEAVIRIPGWHEIAANRHIVIIADADGEMDATCVQYRIVMVQPAIDEYGLRITRLSLERIGDKYAVFHSEGSVSPADSDE